MHRPVTIIGGGLAGLTLGIGLRQRDVPVTIHESGDYPRHRVCGEFISGRGQTVLDHLGLLPDFKKAGAVYARTAMFIFGTAKSPVRELAIPALCLSRYKMDALLAAKFQELGGELRVHSRWNGDTDTLKRGHQTAGNEGMVFATGRRLQPAETETRWFGVKAHVAGTSRVNLEADLEMHISPDGYVGVNRINDGQVNVCGLFRPRPGKDRPESKIEWLRNGPSLRERLGDALFEPESFSSVAGIQLKPRLAATRDECSIGDALTMTPPVTGNGMSMAFESAELAIDPATDYSQGEIDWIEARRQIAARCDANFARRLTWARVLQWMMVAPVARRVFGKSFLNSDWVWQFMFSRTR